MEPANLSMPITLLFSSVRKSTEASSVSLMMNSSVPKVNVPFSAVVSIMLGALFIIASPATPFI